MLFRSEGFDFDGRTRRKEGIRDVRWLGGCDEGVRKICELVGWDKELARLVEKGGLAFDAQAEVKGGSQAGQETSEESKEGDEKVDAGAETSDADVDALVAKVEGVSLAEGQTATKSPAL